MKYKKIDRDFVQYEREALNKVILIFIVALVLIALVTTFVFEMPIILSMIPFCLVLFCCWWLFANNYEMVKLNPSKILNPMLQLALLTTQDR